MVQFHKLKLIIRKMVWPILFGLHHENHKERQVHYEDETDETFGDRDLFYNNIS